MKTNFLIIASCCSILLLSSFYVNAAPKKDDAPVNEKVLKSFHAVFNNASNVQWSQENDHFNVSFTQNDIMVRAEYDRYGNMLSSIRYYDAQHLPLNILCKVKMQYPAKSIDVVTEISTTDGMAYLIQLQDDKGWTILRSDVEGTLSVQDEFEKAK
jgi:hypothetical protein